MGTICWCLCVQTLASKLRCVLLTYAKISRIFSERAPFIQSCSLEVAPGCRGSQRTRCVDSEDHLAVETSSDCETLIVSPHTHTSFASCDRLLYSADCCLAYFVLKQVICDPCSLV